MRKGKIIILLKYLLPAFGACFIFFLIGIRPLISDVRGYEKEIERLEDEKERLSGSLEARPSPPSEERRLWDTIEGRLTSILYPESELTGALTDLASMVREAGARLVTISYDPPASGPTPRSAQRDRMPARQPTSPQQDPRAARIDRSPSREFGSHLPAASKGAVNYSVNLYLEGSYVSWQKLLTEMSKQITPVIIDNITGRPGANGGIMTMSLIAPMLESETAINEKSKITEVEVPPEFVRLYGLKELRTSIPDLFRSDQSEPFPTASAEGIEDAPELVPTAILKRNDEYAAVIGEKILTVGDEINGRRVLEITPQSVIISR